MYKQLLILSSLALLSSSILDTINFTKTSQNNLNIEKTDAPSLTKGLNIVRSSILEIYQQNSILFDEITNPKDAFLLYQKIINYQKEIVVQKAGENKFETAWYWFGYWRWHATWKGLISTLLEITGIAFDVSQTWKEIKPMLEQVLFTYLLTSSPISVVGWIAKAAAIALTISIIAAIVRHKLWQTPQREKGIVMSFYLVIYMGSWEQW